MRPSARNAPWPRCSHSLKKSTVKPWDMCSVRVHFVQAPEDVREEAAKIRLFCFAWTPFRGGDEARKSWFAVRAKEDFHMETCWNLELHTVDWIAVYPCWIWNAFCEAVLSEVTKQYSKCDGHAFFRHLNQC